MSEGYKFDDRDRALLTAAAVLLNKVVKAEVLRSAELVSVAKLLHVLSVLPQVTDDLQVSVSVVGPRKRFDEIETWHYWDVGIEGEQISISSGGHFYHPSTGGDSFTAVSWSAVPEEPSEFEDYREALWMVPDVQSFPDAVAGIELASGSYKIEIIDWDNALLQSNEDPDATPIQPTLFAGGLDNAPIELNTRQEVRKQHSAECQGTLQSRFTQDTTYRLAPNAGDYLLWVRCKNAWCTPPEFTVVNFWEFREGDQLLITNREEDYPAPVQQLEEGGPSLWKVVSGDRLAWIGWSVSADGRKTNDSCPDQLL